jgi:hypothetical protein
MKNKILIASIVILLIGYIIYKYNVFLKLATPYYSAKFTDKIKAFLNFITIS